ncbi:hypothetical protein SAMN05660282_00454 [Corynebacterium spheniscorum]|uniref:Uncharacterized protein n=2 Tax=Corynebacterium spheniscorum TaxID=185761 RepID=A0A1I2QH91_9CORY|nr:hypothetical protein F4V56_10005 [Corynebacterium spheniscorum]SFG27734.1 hypothetical protein SAMN05660282_00454 [Corynebacterium spheniscorum]
MTDVHQDDVKQEDEDQKGVKRDKWRTGEAKLRDDLHKNMQLQFSKKRSKFINLVRDYCFIEQVPEEAKADIEWQMATFSVIYPVSSTVLPKEFVERMKNDAVDSEDPEKTPDTSNGFEIGAPWHPGRYNGVGLIYYEQPGDKLLTDLSHATRENHISIPQQFRGLSGRFPAETVGRGEYGQQPALFGYLDSGEQPWLSRPFYDESPESGDGVPEWRERKEGEKAREHDRSKLISEAHARGAVSYVRIFGHDDPDAQWDLYKPVRGGSPVQQGHLKLRAGELLGFAQSRRSKEIRGSKEVGQERSIQFFLVLHFQATNLTTNMLGAIAFGMRRPRALVVPGKSTKSRGTDDSTPRAAYQYASDDVPAFKKNRDLDKRSSVTQQAVAMLNADLNKGIGVEVEEATDDEKRKPKATESKTVKPFGLELNRGGFIDRKQKHKSATYDEYAPPMVVSCAIPRVAKENRQGFYPRTPYGPGRLSEGPEKHSPTFWQHYYAYILEKGIDPFTNYLLDYESLDSMSVEGGKLKSWTVRMGSDGLAMVKNNGDILDDQSLWGIAQTRVIDVLTLGLRQYTGLVGLRNRLNSLGTIRDREADTSGLAKAFERLDSLSMDFLFYRMKLWTHSFTSNAFASALLQEFQKKLSIPEHMQFVESEIKIRRGLLETRISEARRVTSENRRQEALEAADTREKFNFLLAGIATVLAFPPLFDYFIDDGGWTWDHMLSPLLSIGIAILVVVVYWAWLKHKKKQQQDRKDRSASPRELDPKFMTDF